MQHPPARSTLSYYGEIAGKSGHAHFDCFGDSHLIVLLDIRVAICLQKLKHSWLPQLGPAYEQGVTIDTIWRVHHKLTVAAGGLECIEPDLRQLWAKVPVIFGIDPERRCARRLAVFGEELLQFGLTARFLGMCSDRRHRRRQN